MAMIPSSYFDSVVALGVRNADESMHWVGTGFLYGRLEEKESSTYTIYLLTNKHFVACAFTLTCNRDKIFDDKRGTS